MSWDIFIQDFPPDAKRVAEIAADFRPAPIGHRSDIIAKIRAVIPTADFSNPSWGVIDGDGWAIEVNVGKEDLCAGIALHVRGADAAAGAVALILSGLALRALDSQTGEFFVAGPQAIESFRQWRKYRDRIVGQGPSGS